MERCANVTLEKLFDKSDQQNVKSCDYACIYVYIDARFWIRALCLHQKGKTKLLHHHENKLPWIVQILYKYVFLETVHWLNMYVWNERVTWVMIWSFDSGIFQGKHWCGFWKPKPSSPKAPASCLTQLFHYVQSKFPWSVAWCSHWGAIATPSNIGSRRWRWSRCLPKLFEC